MQKVEVKIKFLHEDAKMPLYATEEAAGFDIYAIEDAEILPGELKTIPTGLSFELPEGYHMQIWDRSGKAKEAVHHLAGVFDSDYRGELRILLMNLSKETHRIEKGDRIVQALVLPIYQAEFKEVKSLTESKREGGFHSTGIK